MLAVQSLYDGELDDGELRDCGVGNGAMAACCVSNRVERGRWVKMMQVLLLMFGWTSMPAMEDRAAD